MFCPQGGGAPVEHGQHAEGGEQVHNPGQVAHQDPQAQSGHILIMQGDGKTHFENIVQSFEIERHFQSNKIK